MTNSKSDSKRVLWLLRLNKEKLPLIFILLVLNVLNAAASTYTAVQSKEIIDLVIKYKGLMAKVIYVSIFYLLALIIFIFITSYIIARLTDYLNFVTLADMQLKLIDSVLSIKNSDLNKYHSGEFQTLLYSDVPNVTNGLLVLFPNFISMLTRLIIAFFFLFRFNKILTLCLAISGIVFTVISNIVKVYAKENYASIQKNNAKTRSFIIDSLSNIITIKVFNKEKDITERIDHLQFNEYKDKMIRSRYSAIASGGFNLLYQLSFMIILIIGGFNISSGSMSLGGLTAVVQLASQVQVPIVSIIGLLPSMWSNLISIKRIYTMMVTNDSNEVNINDDMLTDKKIKQIKIKDLNFSYDKHRILEDVNITINKGDFVVITGQSGSGKSTLMKLMMGLIESDNIYYIMDDDSYYKASQLNYRKMSYVPQKQFLFEDSISKNISFFDEDMDQNMIRFSANISKSDEFIDSLADKYDTLILEGGKRLSEGQEQRIAIARSVYTDSEILFLDESTSALDDRLSKEVLENLSKLDKTIIIITHQRELIEYANRHFHIKDGRVISERR